MSKRSLNVLLAEDNVDHAELVKRSLADHKGVKNFHHVLDGEEALDFVFNRNKYEDKEKYHRPDIILLDLRMPKVDGLQVLKEVKTNADSKTITVVILTTSNAEKDVASAYEYHANSYLVKPVDFLKYNELMVELGYYWLEQNESLDS